jgi:phage terminase large subunit-like protein
VAVQRGPKAKVDESALPWRPRGSESERFVQFCKRFLKVQHGHGAGKELRIRDWQRGLVASVLDSDPAPRLAGWLIARGNGKTSLLAALSVYKMFTSDTGGSIVSCARTQGQAQILFTLARDYVETSPELKERCQIGRERLYVPRNRTTFECLVSEPASLEGLNFSWCALDELGVTPRETVDVLMLAQGKRPESTLVGIGTPPPDATDSVLMDWRTLHQEFGDEYITWREFTADGFEHHDLLCEHCIRLANPAYGDFLAIDAFKTAAKTTREAAYRRARLGQFVSGNDDPFIDPDTWASLSTGEPIPDGAEVVIGVDGAFGGRNSDAAALIIGTVSATPHFDVLAVYENPGNPEWRVPILQLEHDIRDACKRFSVREVTCDPFRLNQTMQTLASEGITVSEWPWSPARTTRATTDLYQAAVNGKISHSGHDVLTRHVLAATVIERDGALRIGKASRKRGAAKVDACAAMLMCHSRSVYLASKPMKRKRTVSFTS